MKKQTHKPPEPKVLPSVSVRDCQIVLGAPYIHIKGRASWTNGAMRVSARTLNILRMQGFLQLDRTQSIHMIVATEDGKRAANAQLEQIGIPLEPEDELDDCA